MMLGNSLAEAIAINLAQVPDLRVLPVPQPDEIAGVGSLERAQAARRFGAARFVGLTVTRQATSVDVALSVVDANENRLLWGTHATGNDDELPAMAALLARSTATALGAHLPKRYDYIGSLTGSVAMTSSHFLREAQAALRRGATQDLLAATEALVAAFEREPDARALRAHALMLAFDADPTQARRTELNEAILRLEEADPTAPYGALYLAYLEGRDNRPADATRSYSAILSRQDLTPAMRAWVLRYRALSKSALEGQAAALGDLEEALQLDPASARTHNILSETLLAVGRTEEALSRAKKAVALMPSFWRHHQTLGLALSRIQRWDEAREAFAAACRLAEAQSPCALHALALWRTGSRAEASVVAARAAKLTEDAVGAYNMACYFALAGDRERALLLIRRALDQGFVDPHMAQDPDLENLRSLPEFDVLLQRLPVSKPDSR